MQYSVPRATGVRGWVAVEAEQVRSSYQDTYRRYRQVRACLGHIPYSK